MLWIIFTLDVSKWTPTYYNTTTCTGRLISGIACEAGWKQHKSSCFKYSHDSRRWDDAKQQCESYNAHLVKIDNQNVKSFVNQIIKEQSFDLVWIGASRKVYETNLLWTDGTSVASEHSSWGSGFPKPQDLRVRRCVAIRKQTLAWEDMSCGAHNPLLCEKGTIWRCVLVFVNSKTLFPSFLRFVL